MTLAVAQACARQCLLNILARVRSLTGRLDAVEQIIKISVFVATTPAFPDLHLVSEGASLLANDLFGPGHVRTTVGVVSLPRNSPVEVEATFGITSTAADRLRAAAMDA